MHILPNQRAGDAVGETSSILEVLADPRRLRILLLLLRQELCVCELVDVVQLPQYEVSRHLAVLKKGGFVDARREGLWAYHNIPSSVRKQPVRGRLLEMLSQRLAGDRVAAADLRRLEKRLELRVGGACVIGL